MREITDENVPTFELKLITRAIKVGNGETVKPELCGCEGSSLPNRDEGWLPSFRLQTHPLDYKYRPKCTHVQTQGK